MSRLLLDRNENKRKKWMCHSSQQPWRNSFPGRLRESFSVFKRLSKKIPTMSDCCLAFYSRTARTTPSAGLIFLHGKKIVWAESDKFPPHTLSMEQICSRSSELETITKQDLLCHCRLPKKRHKSHSRTGRSMLHARCLDWKRIVIGRHNGISGSATKRHEKIPTTSRLLTEVFCPFAGLEVYYF